MITAQGKSFKDDPSVVALSSPFGAPARLSYSGAFFGICLKSGRGIWIDPPDLMKRGVINGQVGQAVAPRNVGKSGLMKSLGVRMLAVQAGNVNGQPKKARALVDDRKQNIEQIDGIDIGEGEWAKWARFVGAKTLDLAELPSINIYHEGMGMSEQHIHELAIKASELESNHRLDSTERFLLLLGINKMYAQFRKIASPGTLSMCLSTLSYDYDLKEYYKEQDRKLLTEHADTLLHEPELKQQLLELMERHTLDGPHRKERNIDEQLFIETAGKLSIIQYNLQQGEFGRAIGGKHSLLDVMHDDRMHWNWTGMSRKARAMIEFVRQTAQQQSLVRPELDIVPTIRLGDEERSAGDELIHLQHRLEYVEKARAFPTFDLTSVQFDQGMAETLGGLGSQERGIVELINKGTAIRFFGKQPYDEPTLHELSRYGIADHDLYQMTQIDRHCWAIQTGESRKLQWVRHVLTPSEWPIVQTNNAVERQTDRIALDAQYSPKFIKPGTLRRMINNGETMQIEPQE